MQRKVSRQPHPTRAPPSFETSRSVRIFNCGQNTLIVRRCGTGMSVNTLFISRIAIICLLSSSLGHFPKSQWERNAEPQSFHSNLPTPLSAQSRYFDQSSKNERSPEGKIRASLACQTFSLHRYRRRPATIRRFAHSPTRCLKVPCDARSQDRRTCHCSGRRRARERACGTRRRARNALLAQAYSGPAPSTSSTSLPSSKKAPHTRTSALLLHPILQILGRREVLGKVPQQHVAQAVPTYANRVVNTSERVLRQRTRAIIFTLHELGRIIMGT